MTLNKNIERIEKELMEQLADIEHQRWSDWQRWCHKILRENCPSKELEAVLERWDKQIVTDYKDLSEKEKESDRKQVRRYLPILSKALREAVREYKEQEIENALTKHNPDYMIGSKKFKDDCKGFVKKHLERK